MSSTEIVIALILLLVFLSGCFEGTYIGNPTLWSDEQVNAYFKSIVPADIALLSVRLRQEGYKWQSDGTNFSPWTDSRATPHFVLSHGGGNCLDFCNLFQIYAEGYQQGVRSYREYIFRNGYAWHYVTVFDVGGDLYEQSNLDIIPVPSFDYVVELWYNKGWKYSKITKEWKR